MTRIMVVDDNADILESTKTLLEILGYDVDTVNMPSEIVEAMRRHKPDLVLQDFHMPGFDVKEHIRLVRKDPELSKMPIVLFTASVENEHEWLRVGADGLIFKPFDVERIQQTIEDHLARRAETA